MALLTRIALAGIAALGVATTAFADPITASEEEVKAAFVFRFGSFVEWPPGAIPVDRPFVIAVAGADGIADQLDALTAERTMDGRAVEVRRLARGQDLGTPEILFIGQAARARLPDLIRAAGDKPILIVTEVEDGIDAGTMIDLVVDGGRVRFDVAAGTAERHGLKISSRVLSIARRVELLE